MAKKMNRVDFLARAAEKFQDTYEYDLTEYSSYRRGKIKVFCKKLDHFNEPHGWFPITPEHHIKGKGGCPHCSATGGYLCRNKKDFVFWGNKFHANKYDYSFFEFINNKTKGLIKCDVINHPDFYMHPNNHLSNKAGCKLCGKIKAGKSSSKTRGGGRSALDRLLEDGLKIYNNKFDYSLIDKSRDLRGSDYVSIICPRHGTITAQIATHLAGHGCRQCADEDNGLDRRKAQADFIKECQRKWNHSDDYYSLVEYRGGPYPIILKCPEHGPFECNSAKLHLQRGGGCQVCAGNQKKSRDEIISLCIQKHGDTYDYSRVEELISTVHDKITITCRIHGPFKQKAVGHYLLGYGCTACGFLRSGLDNAKAFNRDLERAESYCELYLVRVDEYFKIGIAVDTFERDKKNYDDYLLVLPSTRALCWVAEQYLLIQTAWMEPQKLPERFLDWPGRSELRLPEIDQYELIDFMEQALAEAEELGWQEFAKKHNLSDHGYGWDPESAL